MAKKTKKSDVLPGIPFEFEFYMVYWEDIQSDSGWRTLKEIQKSKPAICVSTGWLVKENKDVHLSLIHISEPTRLLSIGYGGMGV